MKINSNTVHASMTFTPAKLAELKQVYEKNKDAEFFMFYGQELLPSYAKYLIEYLEGEFAK